MHHRSLSEPLQGVSSHQGATALRTTQDGASSWGSRLRRRGSARCCLSPPRAASLWVWLLLGALVVPGAWSSLNEEEEELLVELHNRYRGAVVPTASAMMPLKWDPSLKVVAEGYAAKCIWNHNPDLEETGENLYAGTKPLDLQEALKEWFLEHQNYDFNNNSCDEDKMCGHYTQMVWADTHRVGCAMHFCNDMEGLNWGKAYFLVCNYYPAGNYEDVRPYVEGDWCSGCPENFQKCENNLCAEDSVEDEEGDGDDGEDEDGTDIPATTEPFLLPDKEEMEAEAVVPPPATTDVYVPPVTAAAPITTTPSPTPSATPVPPSVRISSAEDSEEIEPEVTPPPGTLPPEAPATTAGRHEDTDVSEEDIEEEVEEEEEEMKPAEKAEREVTVKIFQTQRGSISAASVCAPSLLLACLMGILTLRL